MNIYSVKVFMHVLVYVNIISLSIHRSIAEPTKCWFQFQLFTQNFASFVVVLIVDMCNDILLTRNSSKVMHKVL